ncbi:MAG: hypothetical protein PHN82_03645 [bacterium]|nr:hypothetical protein [bacterium]
MALFACALASLLPCPTLLSQPADSTPTSWMPPNLYYTNVSRTVNGLTANEIWATLSGSSASYIPIFTSGYRYRAYWWSDVSIRRPDGSETPIGTRVAEHEEYTYISYYHFYGYVESDWPDPPAVTLEPGDALKIVETVSCGPHTLSATFITPPLWGGKIAEGKWVFKRYVEYYFEYRSWSPPYAWTDAWFHYGDPGHASTVGGFTIVPEDGPVTKRINFQQEGVAGLSGYMPAGSGSFDDYSGFGWLH